jgi:PAS domain S-box-containing protein
MHYTFEHPLFNDYPDPVFSLDLQGNFLSVNKALVRLAECSEEELLKMSFVSFLPPEHLENVYKIFHKATEGEIQNFEANVVSAKGTPRTLCITNIPIVADGQVVGVYAIAQDITEKKKTEKLLEEHNKSISSILESITDAFFAVDRNWIVTYWNQEAVRLIRIPRKKIVGKNLWDVFKEAVHLKFYHEYHLAMENHVSRQFEEFFPPLKLWLEVSVFPSANGLSVYFKDISKRKHAENQFKIEKNKYRDLFNLSPLPQWVYDVDTLKFLDVNKAAIQHYGYSKKEFLSMTIKDIRPPEEIDALEEVLRSDVKAKTFHRSVVKHRKKTGEIIMVKAEGNSITYGDRSARLVLAVDETEKLKAQQHLEASEQRFKALVQDGSDMIAILDDVGNYIYVSPTSKSVLGVEYKDLINKNIFSFIHEDDEELLANKLLLIDDRQRIKVPPYRFRDSEGNYRWIETIITDMTDDPAISGIITNSRDVTQRILNEIKTEESIERFNIVSRATSDAIWDWDFSTGIVVWNKGISGIFGHKQSSYTQEWWYDHVHPQDAQRVSANLELIIKNKESRLMIEYRFRCGDGTYKHVLDRAFLMFNQDGEPRRMIGSMQDISERVSYINSIEDQNKRLRDIAWIQSHIVRAPLARIMALSRLIYDDNTDEELKKEMLVHLDASAQELDEILMDIVMKTSEISI